MSAPHPSPISTRLVLVGFAESLAAIEACWDLLNSGYRVIAVARRGARVALRQDRRIPVVSITAPERSVAAAVSDLASTLSTVRPDVVLPVDDVALWLASKCDLSPAVLAGPRGRGLEVALDKRLQLRLAANVGLPVPPTSISEDGEVPDGLPFPLVAKPALAVQLQGDRIGRAGTVVCEHPRDLPPALHRFGGPTLLQPQLAGHGEGLFGHATPTGVRAWSAHRRLRMMSPDGSGSSACVAAPVDPHLAQAGNRLMSQLNWRGPFMIELLRSPEQHWFMELNGRLWGSLGLANARGFSYATWAVRSALDESFEPQPPVDPPMRTARHLGRELVHFGFILRGPRRSPTQPWAGRLTTTRELLRPQRGTHWYNTQKGAWRVFVADTGNTLRAHLTSRETT